MSNNKIEDWVQLAVENQDISEYTINIEGKGNKDDGYLSNIIFVTVTGKTKLNQPTKLNLAIKSSKDSETLRKQTPLKEAFEKEIYIYSDVLVEFNKFQENFGNQNFLDFMPKCYASKVDEGREVIIMENLKTEGFTLWDRKQIMTCDHEKLVLEAFGKWHAFSFALKAKKPRVFENLREVNNINIFSYWVLKVGMIDIFFDLYEKARNGSRISESEKQKVHLSKNDVRNIFSDLFCQDVEDHVILHGDCWTNNFMFKSEESSEKPEHLRILDWQCSGFASPVMDLSFFIYSCCNTNKFKKVQNHLKIYHNALSECLNYFAYNAEEIFPFERLLYHWKTFSCYGLLLSSFVMRYSLCDSEDAPDFADAAEKGVSFIDMVNFSMNNEDDYMKRMSDNFVHFIANVE